MTPEGCRFLHLCRRIFFGGAMKNFWKRWQTKMKPKPEREWTAQDYQFDAKGERMLADFELGEAIDALNRFDAQRPQAVQVDGQIAVFFYPEQRKPYAARVSQALAQLGKAMDRESEVIQQYASSKEVRYIGGVRVA
jgi:hypothetical protein